MHLREALDDDMPDTFPATLADEHDVVSEPCRNMIAAEVMSRIRQSLTAYTSLDND